MAQAVNLAQLKEIAKALEDEKNRVSDLAKQWDVSSVSISAAFAKIKQNEQDEKKKGEEFAAKNKENTLQRIKNAQEAQLAIVNSFKAASNAVLGFVKAGLAGTVQGEMLAWQFTLLNREIAGIFLPVIYKLQSFMEQLVQKFRSLTGEQQKNIRVWTLTIIGALAFMVALVKLQTYLAGFTRALKLIAISNPFLLLAGALVGVMAQTEEGREQLSEMAKEMLDAFTEVAKGLGELLLPVLQGVSSILSTATGKWIVFGIVAVAAIRSIYAALGPIGLALMGIATVIGVVSGGSSKGSFKEAIENLGKEVRTGTKSLDEAAKEAEQEIQKRKFVEEEKFVWMTRGNPALQEWNKKRIAEREEAARYQASGILARAAQGKRATPQPKVPGPEDVKATINRVQTSAINATSPKPEEKTAEHTGNILEILRRFEPAGGMIVPLIRVWMSGKNNKD